MTCGGEEKTEQEGLQGWAEEAHEEPHPGQTHPGAPLHTELRGLFMDLPAPNL